MLNSLDLLLARKSTVNNCAFQRPARIILFRGSLPRFSFISHLPPLSSISFNPFPEILSLRDNFASFVSHYSPNFSLIPLSRSIYTNFPILSPLTLYIYPIRKYCFPIFPSAAFLTPSTASSNIARQMAFLLWDI